MLRLMAVTGLVGIGIVGTLSAQAGKPAGPKTMPHEITVTTGEAVYSGTMDLAVSGGKVTGDMRLTNPTEITGTVAGTSKAGVLSLDFPYRMVERQCDGNVKMTIKLPPKPGLGSGTMEAVGCGRDPSQKLTGTVELKPAPPKK